MKKISARWYIVTGSVLIVAISPLIVNTITRGNFFTTLRADYVDGLGVIAGWLGREEAEEELHEEAHLIRYELSIVALEFESEEEADTLTKEAFRIFSEIPGFGRTTRSDGSGEVRYKVPNERKEKLHRKLLDFRLQYRGKKDAQQAGTGQPATRPESKSEGGDKPQPEAEGRSR
jgi:hypothetical protein